MSTDIQKAIAERKEIEKENKDLNYKINSSRNCIQSAELTILKHQHKIREMENKISKNYDRYYALGKVFLNQ